MLFSCGVGLGFNPFINAAEPRGIKPSPRIEEKKIIKRKLPKRKKLEVCCMILAVMRALQELRHIYAGYNLMNERAYTDIK
jgi:hypothetical protein